MYSVYCSDKEILGFNRIVDGVSFPLYSLTGFNKINILIGGNNTGKSRFMRGLFLHANDKSFFEMEGLNNWIRNHDTNLKNRINEHFGNVNIKRKDYEKDLYEIFDNYYIAPKEFTKLNKEIDALSETVFSFINTPVANKLIKIFKGNKLYIPLMRGLNPIYKDSENKYIYKDLYKDRLINQYFGDSHISDDVFFSGQSIYDKLQGMLLGDHENRKKVKDFEKFLTENIFEGKEITIIPRIKSDTVWVRIGDEKEREIHNLGDGIQSLIILTFPIFMNSDKEMMFFIEEPEINMHPGMQRIFLKMLQNINFKKHQFFFTTHSNHFIDLAFDYEDISIFMFRKIRNDKKNEAAFSIERAEAGNIELLKQLGVNNSSVFVTNCTIWVEGITDRLYLREYINRELLKRGEEGKYIENLHYSFIEYGGSSIAHLTTMDVIEDSDDIPINKINNKPKIIADFDREDKKDWHDKRKEKLGECYYYLEGVKEIENTLHEDILKNVIAEYEGKKCEDLQFKSTEEFVQNIYKSKPLGKFIDANLKNMQRKTYSEGEKITTIVNKTDFAKRACKHLKDKKIPYENAMSNSAKELAEKLLNFIEDSNKEIELI